MGAEAPVTTWNTNPDLNGNLTGIPMYEGMPPNLLNDGVRAIMAAVLDNDVLIRALIAANSTSIAALLAASGLTGLTGIYGDFPAGATPPAGWLPAQGNLVSRTGANAALWTFAQASICITADDAAWLASPVLQAGHFSPGDGSTTFRLMDPRGLFRRAWDNGAGVDPGRNIGTLQADQMQGVKYGLNGANGVIASAAGASGGTGVNRVVAGSSILTTDGAVTDGVNGAPRTGLETRPANYSVLTCIHL